MFEAGNFLKGHPVIHHTDPITAQIVAKKKREMPPNNAPKLIKGTVQLKTALVAIAPTKKTLLIKWASSKHRSIGLFLACQNFTMLTGSTDSMILTPGWQSQEHYPPDQDILWLFERQDATMVIRLEVAEFKVIQSQIEE